MASKSIQQKATAKSRRRVNWQLPATIIIALLLWEGLVRLTRLPPFILPSPVLVWERLVKALGDGTLLHNAWFTLSEVLSGLVIGALIAVCLGYLLARSRTMEKMLSPYLVAMQAVPTIAIAPLLVIWFGSGMVSKVIICALTVFFPVLVNTIVGIRSVPENLRDLMRSLQATPVQTLQYLELPAALPILLGGLRIGATLSVIGAVVGEFVGSDEGLGYLINLGRGQYDTALVFVAIFSLVILALALYGCVIFLERRLLRWQNHEE